MIKVGNISGGIGSPAGSKQNWDNIGIRRLTPLECERLQGFPDFWTQYGISEKADKVKISDAQRYKMLGNAVSVPVVKAVMEKLIKEL